LALNTVFEDGFYFLPRIPTQKLIEPPLNIGPSFGKWQLDFIDESIADWYGDEIGEGEFLCG